MSNSIGKYLIVGLGNPGAKYAQNRHNIGFMVISSFLKSHSIEINEIKYGWGALTNSAIFLMPDTFMNNSGKAVKHYFMRIQNDGERLCVIQDDMDIEPGRVILKFDGGDNGHNGIRSINSSIGTNKYYRLRIGVGRPPEGIDPADYLLSDFQKDEMDVIENGIQKAQEAIDIILRDGFVKAMNQINRKNNKSKKEENIND